jgi:anaerobic selenocysteine-containing dehydrogenase
MTGTFTQKIQGYCALCWSSCGCISVVEDGRLVAVEPDPSHPTGKVLCAKGRAAPELVHHDDRLLYPMKRTSPKGDPNPGWQRISWDEALETTAASMKRLAEESGSESVAFGITTPAGTAMQDGFLWVERLRSAFGSPNVVASAEVCNFHVDAMNVNTFGVGLPKPDIANSDCIVLWGHNSSMTWIAQGNRVAEARARGAKLVVVDPRRAGMASKADQWLRVRPGSDGALALGLAGVMIEEGWFDRDFIRSWTNGPFLVREDTGQLLTGADLENAKSANGDSTALRVAWDMAVGQPVLYDPANGEYQNPGADVALDGSYVVDGISCRPAFDHYAALCRQYSPERVEEITWVPASQLRDTAKLIGSSGPVALSCWAGLEQHTNATQTSRSIALLYTLTGSFDTKGGNVIFETVPLGNVMGPELMAQSQREKALGSKARPLGPEYMGYVTAENFYEAVLTQRPYPVRGFINFGPNVLVSHADGARGAEALAKLDFMVHADIFMTPTAAYADIVLPINTPWEREGLRTDFQVDQKAVGHVQLRPQVIEERGESRSDTWTAFALAERLGLGHLFWDGDIDASYRCLLEPSGLNLVQLRENRGGINVPLETRYRKFAGGRQERPGFNTPSRKIEMFSQSFLAHGYSPLPEYVEPLMGHVARPDLVDRFPLVLTSAKSPRYLQSQMRGVAKLRRVEPDPRIEIHPETAEARGIADGDWMVLSTPHGRTRGRAHYSRHLDPRVISATHGWWQACEALSQPSYDPASEVGANLNAVIGNDACDPVTGSVPLKSYLCQVEALTVRPA